MWAMVWLKEQDKEVTIDSDEIPSFFGIPYYFPTEIQGNLSRLPYLF